MGRLFETDSLDILSAAMFVHATLRTSVKATLPDTRQIRYYVFRRRRRANSTPLRLLQRN